MDRHFRYMHILSRHFWRRPYSIAGVKSIVPASNEEVNEGIVASFNRDIKAGGTVPVFRRALLFPNRVAVQDEVGIYTYTAIHKAAVELSKDIDKQLLGESGQTIAYLSGNDASNVITQWAIWMAGNIAVPLASIHPPDMLKYFIEDSHAALVICSQEHENTLGPIAKELKRNFLITTRDRQITAQLYQSKDVTPNIEDVGKNNFWYAENDALIIYTSGTTSKPKGVVWTHNMLAIQICALHTAWQYNANDVVLHTLPLHHIHGQLNSLNASLAAGARLRMLPSFTTHTVWARLLGMGERDEVKVSVFHGVPAMYARLAADHEKMFPDAKTATYVKQTLSKMRLMCAGSAPLPSTLFNKWEEISGQRLLERYGMSEVGMALSNPYRPVEQRTVACVGQPLPGVTARIAAPDDTGKLVPLVTVESSMPDLEISLEGLGLVSRNSLIESSEWKKPKVTEHREPVDGVFQGELLLKGSNVFTRYLNRPPTLDGSDFVGEWFRTGDTASYNDGRFKILGRTSVDIIKTAGYKVSALQVESALLELDNVADAAALGVPNDTYGEIVAAVVALKDSSKPFTLATLQKKLASKLAPYQIPRALVVVDQMPRNAMGKLDKKEIRKLYGKDLALKK